MRGAGTRRPQEEKTELQDDLDSHQEAPALVGDADPNRRKRGRGDSYPDNRKVTVVCLPILLFNAEDTASGLPRNRLDRVRFHSLPVLRVEAGNQPALVAVVNPRCPLEASIPVDRAGLDLRKGLPETLRRRSGHGDDGYRSPVLHYSVFRAEIKPVRQVKKPRPSLVRGLRPTASAA